MMRDAIYGKGRASAAARGHRLIFETRLMAPLALKEAKKARSERLLGAGPHYYQVSLMV